MGLRFIVEIALSFLLPYGPHSLRSRNDFTGSLSARPIYRDHCFAVGKGPRAVLDRFPNYSVVGSISIYTEILSMVFAVFCPSTYRLRGPCFQHSEKALRSKVVLVYSRPTTNRSISIRYVRTGITSFHRSDIFSCNYVRAGKQIMTALTIDCRFAL